MGKYHHLPFNGKITSKKIIDKTAKYAIANSDYTFVKYGGNRHGHMELHSHQRETVTHISFLLSKKALLIVK